ncbi:MAG TPA: hypothetical protein VFT45_10110 [Longimicrobium sp.]|nr:hypothetical protein [Longimicrobium sp.]
MGKIRLEIETLHVESFTPAEAPMLRGTVHGMASLYWEDCNESETCPGAGWPCGPSEQSCGGTCYEHTCHPGCGGGGGTGGCSAVTLCYMGTTCIDQDPT